MNQSSLDSPHNLNIEPTSKSLAHLQLNAASYTSGALFLMSLILGAFVTWDLASTTGVDKNTANHHSTSENARSTSAAIRAIFVSPDGHSIDVAQGTTHWSRRDAQSGREIHNTRLSRQRLIRLQFLDNSRDCVAINSRNELELIRDEVCVSRGTLPAQQDDEILIECAVLAPRNRIAVASRRGSLWFADVGSTDINPTKHLSVDSPLADMKASPTGDLLALVTGQQEVLLWDIQREQIVQRIVTEEPAARFVSWSQDGQRLVTFGYGATIKIWDVATGACVNQITIDAKLVVCAKLSPDGTVLAIGANDRIRVWDLTSDDERFALTGHSALICCLEFADNGKTLYSGDLEGGLRRWSLRSNQEVWAVP